MANIMFPLTAQRILTELTTGDVVAVLIASSYVYSPTHANLSDISGSIVDISDPLTNKTVDQPVPGVFDADDAVFTSVTGSQIGSIALAHDTGNPATSELLWHLTTVTGLPATPDGRNITITWSSGTARIAKIAIVTP